MTAPAVQLSKRPGPGSRPPWQGAAVSAPGPWAVLADRLLCAAGHPDVPYSISTGSIETGYTRPAGQAYITALTEFSKQFINSIVYGGIATILPW